MEASVPTKPMALDQLIQKAKEFANSAKAPATVKAYRSDWLDFEQWCYGHQLVSLPAMPETVAFYIADRASTLASGTITRRLTSITHAHRANGHSDTPATTHHAIVGETLSGIRRSIGTAQRGKAPLLSVDIRKIIAASPESLLGSRDRALVLVGFAGAFRRSELARIDYADLTFSGHGIVIDLRKSKTDQEGAGRKVALPWGMNVETCPVLSLRTWLDAAHITDGSIFRAVDRQGQVSKSRLNKDSIGVILKRAAARAGLKTETLGGHSLRAGHVTQAAMNGVSEFVIMKQTGHRSVSTLRRYIRLGEMFTQNAASGLGI
jgi:integrase